MPDVSFIKGKAADEQQKLQSTLRLRELAVSQKTASGNQLKALLLEFIIRVSSRRGLGGVFESVLENAEDELPMTFREALNAAWQHHLVVIKSIAAYDRCLEESVEQHENCKTTALVRKGRRDQCRQFVYSGGLCSSAQLS